jgi:hypothetical protein
MKFWDDVNYRYIDATVLWNGTMHRRDEQAHSLLNPMGWQQKDGAMSNQGYGHGALPSKKEYKNAALPAADLQYQTKARRKKLAAKGKAA